MHPLVLELTGKNSARRPSGQVQHLSRHRRRAGAGGEGQFSDRAAGSHCRRLAQQGAPEVTPGVDPEQADMTILLIAGRTKSALAAPRRRAQARRSQHQGGPGAGRRGGQGGSRSRGTTSCRSSPKSGSPAQRPSAQSPKALNARGVPTPRWPELARDERAKRAGAAIAFKSQ